jgi:sodium/myo-inositol cotransporter 11
MFREGGTNPDAVSILSRVFVLLLVLVSILWIPVVQASHGGQLFIYIQAISSYLQPPVAVVFIMGCFWKRTNEKVCTNLAIQGLHCSQGEERWGLL